MITTEVSSTEIGREIPCAVPQVEDVVDTAARHMYEAEIMLHCARQSHIDAWVTAAYERLHEAVHEHDLAMARASHDAAHRRCGAHIEAGSRS